MNDLQRIVQESPHKIKPSSAIPAQGPWLTYEQAAEYTGWSVRYLRNLVSAVKIPVYGPVRSRRFRLDMIDLFLTDRDAAMRKFRLEREARHGH